MATPTIRQVTSVTGSTDTNSVTTTAASAVGDIIVAINQSAFRTGLVGMAAAPAGTTAVAGSTTIINGWRPIVTSASASGARAAVGAWAVRVTAAGAKTITASPGGTSGQTNSLIVYVISGAELTLSPIDGTPSTASGTNSVSQSVPQITPGLSDSLLIGSWGSYFTADYTGAPSGMSMAAGAGAETNFSANNAHMAASQALTSGSPTGAKIPVGGNQANANASWAGVLFAIKGPPRAGSALATIRLTASATNDAVTRGGAPSAALVLKAYSFGAKANGASSTAAVRLTASLDGVKSATGSSTATLKLTATSTGNKVNIGFAVIKLGATVADVLHAGTGIPGTVPAALSLVPSEALYPSPTLYPAGSPVTDPVRLSASTAQNTRTTSAVSVAAVLLLGTSSAASSTRAADTWPAPLYLSADANSGRVVAEIGVELREKTPSTVAYELVCVAVVPQAGGPPTHIEVDPIAWTGLSYTDQLSKAQTLSAGCQISNLTEAVLQRLRNPAELPSELWLYRAGRLVFAGPLLGGQVQGEALTLQAKGLLSYLDRMVVNADMVFSQVDQFDIAVALIDQWQNLEYGDYGIDTAGIGPCGVKRDATYLAKEENYIGQRVAELGARENGFDVAVDPSSRKLRLSYPVQGVDRSSGEDAVVFDSRNVTSPNIVFAVGPGDVASEAYGTGTGTAGTVFSVRSNPELRAKYGRSAVTGTWNGVSEQTTLDAHVQGLLDARGTALLIPGPDVRVTPDADLSMWDVGDTVSYQLHSQLSIEGAYRLRERRVTVSKTGQESVSVAFV